MIAVALLKSCPPFVMTSALNVAPLVPNINPATFVTNAPFPLIVSTLPVAAPVPMTRLVLPRFQTVVVAALPPLTTVTLLLEDAQPIVLTLALNNPPPLVTNTLLPLAPFVPTTSALTKKRAPLASVTLLLNDRPAPTTKPSVLVQVELFPVTKIVSLLQPLPTTNGVALRLTTVPLLTVSELVPVA